MKKTRGLTLIELMVVVAVIGILAGVAYPSYRSHVLKSRRSEALTMLQAAQLAQEKYRLNNATYASTAQFTDPAFTGVCNLNTATMACLSQNGYYLLTASAASASAYTVQAQPQGAQQRDTRCSPLVVTQQATATTFSPPGCWSK